MLSCTVQPARELKGLACLDSRAGPDQPLDAEEGQQADDKNDSKGKAQNGLLMPERRCPDPD